MYLQSIKIKICHWILLLSFQRNEDWKHTFEKLNNIKFIKHWSCQLFAILVLNSLYRHNKLYTYIQNDGIKQLTQSLFPRLHPRLVC